MSNQQNSAGTTQVTTRKKRRGMIEKRRRDKINNSLCELRRLVPAAFEKQGSAKLEKAEILQMTVDYLRMLHARGLADHLTNNKQQPMRMTPDDSSLTGHNQATLVVSRSPVPPSSQAPSSLLTPEGNQLNNSGINTDNNDSSRTSISLPANNSHSVHSNQFEHHLHQQSHHLAAGDITSSPSLMHATAASHHLYNQHHHMPGLTVDHATAAAAYHHLSNPLGPQEMGTLPSVHHHQHPTHYPMQQYLGY